MTGNHYHIPLHLPAVLPHVFVRKKEVDANIHDKDKLKKVPDGYDELVRLIVYHSVSGHEDVNVTAYQAAKGDEKIEEEVGGGVVVDDHHLRKIDRTILVPFDFDALALRDQPHQFAADVLVTFCRFVSV